MNPLTIELVKGQKREFTFLGWKHDGLALYATRSDGYRAVIELYSAYPHHHDTGEPYRFPRTVPITITPKRFEIFWGDNHRDVLRRWMEAKLAAVDAETEEMLFRFGVWKDSPKRTPAEISLRKQEIKERVERHFSVLMATPLDELLDPIAFPYLLDDFHHGRWADEMGEDFGVMMNEAGRFNRRWHDAYDRERDHRDHQGRLCDLRSVRLVMRGDDGEDYPLTGVDVRRPTDLEAQAYVVMQQDMPGANALPSGDVKVATQAHVLTRLDMVAKQNDQVLAGVKALTDGAGEQALTRDKWAENPLGSREGGADYLLTMRAVGIKGERAAALVHFGYGETRKKCAAIAGVSVESIKRDLARARQTPYARFFARTPRQRSDARKAMKKPDDAFARIKQLAKEDPDSLRATIDQVIAKAQAESGDSSAWEDTVAGL